MAATAAFSAIDANHDGSISRAEFASALGGGGVTTYAAPVTYAAPSSVTYAAPVTTLQPVTTLAAPVSYAAPVRAVQQREVVIPTDRRLLAGTIIGESQVTREQLIMQGRLIEDEVRMQQILQQTSQMAGYMSNAYGVGMHLTDFTHLQQAQNPIVVNTVDTRPQPGQRINIGNTVHHGGATHHIGAQAAEERLEISFLQASNLRHHMLERGMYASCELVKHKFFGRTVKCSTQSIKDLNPVWNEMHHLDGYHPGDHLKFTISDQLMIGHANEGGATLNAEQFYPNGWEGKLPIKGLPDAFIELRVLCLGPVPRK